MASFILCWFFILRSGFLHSACATVGMTGVFCIKRYKYKRTTIPALRAGWRQIAAATVGGTTPPYVIAPMFYAAPLLFFFLLYTIIPTKEKVFPGRQFPEHHRGKAAFSINFTAIVKPIDFFCVYVNEGT